MFSALLMSAALLAAAEPPAAPAPAAAKAAPAGNTVDPAVATAKPKDDPMKLVCRTETPIGSRFSVKRCMTKGEAEMQRFEQRQELERMQGDTYHH